VQALGRLKERGEGRGARDEGLEEAVPACEPEPAATGALAQVRPEYKVAAVTMVALVLVLFARAWVYAAVFALLCALAAVGRVRPAALLSGLRRAWPLLVAAFALPVLFSPWGRILLQLGPLRITEPGLREGGLFAARLLLLLLATRLLASVTAPADLARGIARLLSPLRCLGIDPDSIGQALGLAWAFFPAMLGRARESIRCRGLGRSRLDRLVNLPGDVVADLYLSTGVADSGASR
jgi:energy-coupling factor transporter transmembrane protein EcfT